MVSRILGNQRVAPRLDRALDRRLELPRVRWYDSTGFGPAVSASLVLGVVLVTFALGWWGLS